MRISSKLAIIALSATVGFQLVAPVYAKEKEEGVKVRGDVKAELDVRSEKAGSRPGLLRNFFIKSRAAIGSGIITEISGTTLKVKDKDGKVVTVLTDDKTQFRRKFWGKGSLAEMSVGDTVNVIGLWTDDTKTTIQARLIRDTSIQKRFGIFFGSIFSTSSSGFVMKTEKRGDVTVTVDTSTKLINRTEQTIVLGDVKVDHKVRVKGLWDSKLNTLKEVIQVKDFSLPTKPTPTATPTP